MSSTEVAYAGDPIHRYTRTLMKKNYHSYCTCKQMRPDGVYQCTFNKREADLKKDIAAGIIHQCVFKKQDINKTILGYFTPTTVEKSDGITYEDLLNCVAIFVGRRNLSLEAGACDELQRLIKTAIQYGIQNHKRKLDDIYRKYSSDTVRRYMIAASTEVNKLQFNLFSKLPYVGVSCDEGSTRGVHDLDFVLEAPLSTLKPYPCFTSVMPKGDATTYTEHLARGLDFLRINNIPVGSITVDGNRAQLKALSFTWPDSLRRRYVDHNDFMKRIIVNPCLCHRINNAYKRAYNWTVDLLLTVDNMRDISEECRKRPQDVLGVCPKVQPTRWIVDYDICSFIIEHNQLIQRFKKFDLNKLLDLQKVLSILKSLTNIFEDPKTPHFKAFRILEDAIGALEDLEDEVEYAKDVKTQLINYVQNSEDAGIWMLSYLLTPKGREDFHDRISKKKFPPKPNYKAKFVVSKSHTKEDIEELIEMSLDNVHIPPQPIDYSNDFRQILEPKNEEEEEEHEEEDNLPWELIEEEEEDIMELDKKIEKEINEEEEKEDKKEDEKEPEFSYDPSSENEVDENPPEDPEMKKRMLIYPAQRFLETTLRNWGIAPLSCQRTMNAFNSYIKSSDDPFKDQRLENGDYYWEHIKGSSNPIWETIAEIAMRLHCASCSEASCERTISLQRLVLTARRMSSKKDLLDARLTLLRGLNNDDD